MTRDARGRRSSRSTSAILVGIAALLAACGSEPEAPDASVSRDAGRDAGVDAGPILEPDAGPPPLRPVALEWVSRVTSTQTLGGVAEARLARAGSELGSAALVLSLTTSGAPTTFGADTPEARAVGDATTPVTQAAAYYDEAGTLLHARPIATATDADFAAIGYALAAFPDGAALFGGRFVGGGHFGAFDPARVTLATTAEMPDEDTRLVAAEGYLARFGADRRVTHVASVGSSAGLDDHQVLDLAPLADGSLLALGRFSGDATLGSETLGRTPGSAGEVFVARLAADLSPTWVTRVAGTSEPRRLAAFDDGGVAVLVRYGGALVVGPGEDGERTLPAPPAGTLAWDAVLCFEPDGALSWARPVGSGATTYPGLRALRAHTDGSVTVVGTFRGDTAWPDAEEIPTARIAVADALLTRIDADGSIRWQTRIRAARDLLAQALAPSDDDGTWVLLTVGAEGASFEPSEGPPLVLPAGTINQRLVLLRYASDGALAAGQLLASTDVDGDDLLRLPSGDLVIVGRYGEGTVLEPGAADERALPDAEAERNVFVARYRVE